MSALNPIGVAFGRYALPSDDLLYRLDPTITVLSGGEDPDYPITNWAFRKPAKPAKFLSAFEVAILFDFGAPANAAAFALVYSNLDPGTPVTLAWGTTSSASDGTLSIVVPDAWEDRWTASPWDAIPGTPTKQYWLLTIGGSSPSNSYPISIGRPAMLGALRDLGNDVRWGIAQEEVHGSIVHPSLFEDETIYAMGGKRRALLGEITLRNELPHQDAQTFVSLCRSAQTLIEPWILIPDVDVNDAWMVRFVDDRWTRVYETLNQNNFPFRVRELSRGRPWPYPPNVI